MKNKLLFISSFVIMIIALLCMGVNFFVSSFPDYVVRITGIVILIDIFLLVYSRVRLKNQSN